MSKEIDLIARGMRWADAQALIETAMEQAGIDAEGRAEIQPLGWNICHRTATAAHKAGFTLGMERMKESLSAPIDMVLYCPACGKQHIDRPNGPEDGADWNDPEITWTNPPHRSHLCHGCGHIWRPADVPTNGVAAVKTKGKDDSPVPLLTRLKADIAAPQPRLTPVGAGDGNTYVVSHHITWRQGDKQ